MRARRSASPVWPTAAIVLFALGLLSVLAVTVTLGRTEATGSLWTLLLAPAALLAAASLAARRRPRAALPR